VKKSLSTGALVAIIFVIIMADVGFTLMIFAFHILPAIQRGYWMVLPLPVGGYIAYMFFWHFGWYIVLSKRTRKLIKKILGV